MVLLVCVWNKYYTPPRAKYENEKRPTQETQNSGPAKKEKDTAVKIINPQVTILQKNGKEVVVEGVQMEPVDKWEPVVDATDSLPEARFVSSKNETTNEAGSANTATIIVVEAPVRQNRYDDIYGAFGGGNFNPNAGLYCNGFGNSPWPCQQFQSNFANQTPVYSQPTVIVQSAPSHVHHDRHRHNNNSEPIQAPPHEHHDRYRQHENPPQVSPPPTHNAGEPVNPGSF